MEISIRVAMPPDGPAIVAVLREAAQWLIDSGMPMWRMDELEETPAFLAVAEGAFRVAEIGGELAGVMRFQLEDPLFWPELPPGEAAYIHRLAVRRKFAGKGVATALMRSAENEARRIGRRFLRLDTEASREKLCALYVREGFREHSRRAVGPYFVARFEKALL